MLADLDRLLTAVFATADDLLPDRRKNAKRSVTDPEVVTLAVAQAIMDIASDREFLAVARARLRHLIPRLPKQPGLAVVGARGVSRSRVSSAANRACFVTPRRAHS
jgi:hypothetical protein